MLEVANFAAIETCFTLSAGVVSATAVLTFGVRGALTVGTVAPVVLPFVVGKPDFAVVSVVSVVIAVVAVVIAVVSVVIASIVWVLLVGISVSVRSRGRRAIPVVAVSTVCTVPAAVTTG